MTIDAAEPASPPAEKPESARSASSGAALAALACAAGSAAILAGAYVLQYGFGVPPCPLCLDQRIPHYIAVALGLAVALLAAKDAPRPLVLAGLAALALALVATAGVGVYHAGVEWKLWSGPADCSGPIQAFDAGISLIERMKQTAPVRCDEAPIRVFGISLAGFNVLMSLGLAAVAGWGFARTRKALGG